jgi:class 3 adenylate cyclase
MTLAMEPRIQYAKTSDGVSIAYAVAGAGLPVVFASPLFGGLHMASTTSRPWPPVEQLVALGWQVVIYDGRGTGSSERDRADFSLEARMLDLDAVIDGAAQAKRCVVVGSVSGGPAAIAFAAQNPERVSHLVLRNAYASGAERDDTIFGMLVMRLLRPTIEEHWDFFTLTIANAMVGYTDSERAKEQADAYRTAISPQGFPAATAAMDRIDASVYLESVRVPCLVVNDTGVPAVAAGAGAMARKLASRIPNARLVVTDDFPRALDAFLREGRRPDSAKASALPSGTAIILFADIADSTALTEQLGDAAFRAKARDLDEALRRAIAATGGIAIEGKLLGDGVLATFSAAREAIAAAAAMHEAARRVGLVLHVGIHAGDVILEENNVYGGAVNIAARISGEAAAGETLVSQTVRDLARTSAGVVFQDRGEHELKGVSEPVRLFSVRAENAYA